MLPSETSRLQKADRRMAVSDDEIFRRKLLIEGDGGQDDKRISNLIRNYIRWYNADVGSEESEELERKIDSQLAACEFAMEKTTQVFKMNKQEQRNYEKQNRDIEQMISQAYTKISDCKKELTQAKQIRKNRQEYDALAKVIQQHPDREETQAKMEALDKEIESLKETKESLDKKLDLRRKQFHVLVTAIHEMQSILAEDEQKEEGAMETS